MKKLLLCFLSVIVIFSIFLGTDYMVLASKTKSLMTPKKEDVYLDSSLFTQADSNQLITQEPVDFDTDGFEKAVENSKMALYTNIKTGAIRLVNKNNGYVWCSDVLNANDPKFDFANAALRQVQSAFSLNYRDENNNPKVIRTSESGIKLTKSVSGSSVKFKANADKLGISFEYTLTLDGTKLNLVLDHESIKEDKNRITAITFFPYFGSTYKQEVPAYGLIPSGSGALVRFDKEPTINSKYTCSFYGNDANLVINNEGELLNLPVYGIVHGANQNGMMVEIKNGTTFATLTYSPSNVDQNFNMIYPTFNYRETYLLSIPSADSILMIPENYYKSNVEIEYSFFDGDDASYVGFAKDYQKTLVDRGILTKQEVSTNDIKASIEAFGRDYEPGLILKKYYNMTTTKDIKNINETLEEAGVNAFYVLRAFNKNGYSAQSVSNYKFDSKLGSLRDLDDLESYFYYNPVESYNSSRKYPSKVLVNMYNEKNFIKVGVNKFKFYASVSAVKKYTTKALDKYDDIALDGIGYRLYGDHNNSYSKIDTLDIFTNLLGDRKTLMYSPNYYFLKNTSMYLNMPLYSERLRFFTDSVPFLEIILKGYIDYYSPYLNFSSNSELDVLKCIEYGCNPAYLVSEKESYLLADTLSSNYYATTFSKCQENIVKQYSKINSVLKQVNGSTIISRNTLITGVYAVGYSNGKTIIVNYTSNDYDYMGTNISSMGYEVI